MQTRATNPVHNDPYVLAAFGKNALFAVAAIILSAILSSRAFFTNDDVNPAAYEFNWPGFFTGFLDASFGYAIASIICFLLLNGKRNASSLALKLLCTHLLLAALSIFFRVGNWYWIDCGGLTYHDYHCGATTPTPATYQYVVIVTPMIWIASSLLLWLYVRHKVK